MAKRSKAMEYLRELGYKNCPRCKKIKAVGAPCRWCTIAKEVKMANWFRKEGQDGTKG